MGFLNPLRKPMERPTLEEIALRLGNKRERGFGMIRSSHSFPLCSRSNNDMFNTY